MNMYLELVSHKQEHLVMLFAFWDTKKLNTYTAAQAESRA